jgi:hypothetical protein
VAPVLLRENTVEQTRAKTIKPEKILAGFITAVNFSRRVSRMAAKKGWDIQF